MTNRTDAQETADFAAARKRAAAFEMVCPKRVATELADRGMISAESAASKSWKDPICCVIGAVDLEAAGLTIADVSDAVSFYTATPLHVQACRVVGFAWATLLKPEDAFFVQAPGYRAGPAW